MARANKTPRTPPPAHDHGGSDPSTGDKTSVIKQSRGEPAKGSATAGGTKSAGAPKATTTKAATTKTAATKAPITKAAATKAAAKKETPRKEVPKAAPTRPRNAVPLRQSTRLNRAGLTHSATASEVTDPPQVEMPTHSESTPPRRLPVEAKPPFTGLPPTHGSAWADVVREPGRGTERLAAAAVRQLGPEAAQWVASTKDWYPRATPDGLARLASRHFTKVARREGVANGAAGLLGSLAATGVLARTHARLVLHIAAAYGLDPLGPERARDLVELLRIPRRSEPARAAIANSGRLIAPVLVRLASARLVPFGAAITEAVHGGRSTADLTVRAMRYFRDCSA